MNPAALALPDPAVEVLPRLANGTIVRCPDGTVGEQAFGTVGECHVIHADRTLGRGPWIFARYQIEVATAEEAAGYAKRCMFPAHTRKQSIPVVAGDMSEVWTMGEWAERMVRS